MRLLTETLGTAAVTMTGGAVVASLFAWLRAIFTREAASPFPPGTGPARLLVMRHGEKTGDANDPHLSSKGIERAKRLADYIPQTFGRIDFIFAARNSKKSTRPRATVEPLAAALGLPIDGRFDDEDDAEGLIAELAKAAYAGKTGLISWRHSELPDLIAALGAPEGTVPATWDTGLYNLIVEIDYRRNPAPAVRKFVMPF